MNRRLTIAALLLAAAIPGFAQVKKTINISGKVQILNPEPLKKYNMVWLKKGAGASAKTVDSVAVKPDGSFSFKLPVSKPGVYQLDILKWQTTAFWADQDLTVLARGYDTSKYQRKNSGFVEVTSKSPGTRLINMAMYDRYLDEIVKDDLLDEGFAAQKNRQADTAWYTYYRKQMLYRKVEELGDARERKLIAATGDHPASVYLLATSAKKDGNYILGQLDKLLAADPTLEDAIIVRKELAERIAQERKLQKGSVAPEIAYKNPEGKVTSLSSYKGKYVLVDFWASWCGPCRKSIPRLKELYGMYNAKGFDILSISVDKDSDAWRRAMAEEQMPWSQVISPNSNKTLSDFMIQGIPTMFLLDRDGKIVERFTGYSSRLDELLKEKMGA
ncbi:AhpC/TSA family protein [Chitinophaga sedimenti]|uniref:TlpA disulfide reductase family protein n=1 Tax=Chitinophaga sedimenti TaxID=2033606 RepID=UPI002002A99B|nr:TlpA disulfide reductase family protein [Chitinophaga sedimenti]MCK7554929.1 AhpC/TSA family protein [Chitinophaga sedimenti]